MKESLIFFFVLALVQSQANPACDDNTIEVTGSATLNVAPDLAIVNLQIQSSGLTTADATTQLAQKVKLALSSLTNSGLNSSNWKITYFYVYQNTSYVNGTYIFYGQIAT